MANRDPEFEEELRANEVADDLVNYIVDNCDNSNLFAAYVDDESETTGSSAQHIECSVRCALPFVVPDGVSFAGLHRHRSDAHPPSASRTSTAAFPRAAV